MVNGQGWRQAEGKTEILPHGLPLQVDEDAGGSELLNTGVGADVGGRKGLGLGVHVVQLEDRDEVSRGILLDRAGDKLEQNPHKLVPEIGGDIKDLIGNIEALCTV